MSWLFIIDNMWVQLYYFKHRISEKKGWHLNYLINVEYFVSDRLKNIIVSGPKFEVSRKGNDIFVHILFFRLSWLKIKKTLIKGNAVAVPYDVLCLFVCLSEQGLAKSTLNASSIRLFIALNHKRSVTFLTSSVWHILGWNIHVHVGPPTHEENTRSSMRKAKVLNLKPQKNTLLRYYDF